MNIENIELSGVIFRHGQDWVPWQTLEPLAPTATESYAIPEQYQPALERVNQECRRALIPGTPTSLIDSNVRTLYLELSIAQKILQFRRANLEAGSRQTLANEKRNELRNALEGIWE